MKAIYFRLTAPKALPCLRVGLCISSQLLPVICLRVCLWVCVLKTEGKECIEKSGQARGKELWGVGGGEMYDQYALYKTFLVPFKKKCQACYWVLEWVKRLIYSSTFYLSCVLQTEILGLQVLGDQGLPSLTLATYYLILEPRDLFL